MNLNLIKYGIMACIFVVFNIVFLVVLFFTRRKMKLVQNWPSTLGTVNASYLERRQSSDDRGSTNYPVVQYSYQVNGQLYQSARLAPGPEVGGSGAGKVIAKYPMGAQVVVFYDPTNPSDAVLEKNAPAQWLIWLVLIIFDLILCGMGIGFLFIY